MSALVIGYDVEVMEPESDVTRRFLEVATRTHAELEAPATLFLVGITARNNAEAVREAMRQAPFELGSHMYSHVLLKTLCQVNEQGTTVYPGGSYQQIVEEVDRSCQVLAEEFGVQCRSLCSPWGYYRGLSDRPDLLHVLHAAGIRICRTWMRNADDWVPVSLDLQPFWYEAQGFPDMLEFPITGRHDCNWPDYYGFEPGRFQNAGEFLDYLKIQLDYVKGIDGIWNATQHDHTTMKYDPEMTIMRGLIEHARSIGMEVLHFSEVYERMARERGQTVSA